MSPSKPAHSAQDLLSAFIKTTKEGIIPLTAKGVSEGAKVFGAAILRKDDLSVILAATNNEVDSPLLHGEINCIQQFYALPADKRPNAKDCLFFATHEPCSLCLSGITWGGFDNFYYLFTYEDTRDAFGIPHDIRILEEVFRTPSVNDTPESIAQRPLYNRTNAFFHSHSLMSLVESLPNDEQAEWLEKIQGLKGEYNGLSEVYQKSKGGVGIPLA